MNTYTPEMGQACFGQPWKEYGVPGYLDSHLNTIAEEVERVFSNVYGSSAWGEPLGGNPFHNSGNVEGFVCGPFEVHAYDWNILDEDTDDEQPFNFKWRDLEVSWYKYLGRGMSMNRETTPHEAAELLDECMAALAEWERDNTPEHLRPF